VNCATLRQLIRFSHSPKLVFLGLKQHSHIALFSRTLMLLSILFLSVGKPLYTFYSDYSSAAVEQKAGSHIDDTDKSFFSIATDTFFNEAESEDTELDFDHIGSTNSFSLFVLNATTCVAQHVKSPPLSRVAYYILFQNWKLFSI
jgi:hypothetical protein